MRHTILIIIMIVMLAAFGSTDCSAQVVGMGAMQQQIEPITWRGSARMTSLDTGIIRITATIADGWHLYGMEMPADGPKATAFSFKLPQGFKLVGDVTPQAAPFSKHDAMFASEVSYWEGTVTFTQRFRVTSEVTDAKSLSCSVSYMGCNDQTCLPPKTKKMTIKILPKK